MQIKGLNTYGKSLEASHKPKNAIRSRRAHPPQAVKLTSVGSVGHQAGQDGPSVGPTSLRRPSVEIKGRPQASAAPSGNFGYKNKLFHCLEVTMNLAILF